MRGKLKFLRNSNLKFKILHNKMDHFGSYLHWHFEERVLFLTVLSTTALLHTLNSVGSAVRLKQHPVRLPLASGIIGGCIGAALCRR